MALAHQLLQQSTRRSYRGCGTEIVKHLPLFSHAPGMRNFVRMSNQPQKAEQSALFNIPIEWKCPLCGCTQMVTLGGAPTEGKCPCKLPILFNMVDLQTGEPITPPSAREGGAA